MRSSGDALPSQNGRRAAAAATATVSNNPTGNSGSQYALCALGMGLVALGVIMIVWSVVPTDAAHNHSVSTDPDPGGKKSKASSVAFVLVGSGVAVLLLSLCLGMRNKQRERQFLQRQQQQRAQSQAAAGRTAAEAAEEQARRYAVPTYEEAVGSGPYPVPQPGPRLSSSQLPSYEDLVTADSLQYEHEGPATLHPPTPPSAATLTPPPPPSTRKQGRSKLLPINIRRIKSEKLHMKDVSQPPSQMSIEPLTPPPQYEDKAPPL